VTDDSARLGDGTAQLGETTYREVLADSNILLPAFVWGIALLAFLWFILTGEMVRSGLINHRLMVYLRAPALAVVALIWLWAIQAKTRDLFS